ncbi:transcription initiation factor TFIID complex 60 kDa subunit [Tothia fuscella]|uniref:TBP-associated factor 6 n=1 Tax=Tothia fuscella TaxID=1048955 RepID=A0A9P4TWT0_9PEZI|nr:transcription initiation factor TFIID complex 60 kDa subunit [Tothia fuscella]
MSLWNPDNIRDVAESVGISSLDKEVTDALGRDVDFRVSQVLEEAIKFMRHSRRTTLHTEDISQALKVLDVEPLFGYDSTRPLRFGEASIGPGQPLYYVEDEEVDFEKLINAPLPKVPREISFTAHWLAVEGVQPSIPQNPTSADSRHQELLPKGPGANPSLAALSGADSVSVKPLVKHILSSEIQLYFERITHAILDDQSEDYRNAAFNSLRTDPGLHQLLPYFIHFINEKVTHKLKDLFVLTQMLNLFDALLHNPSLYVDPYISSFVPPVLTCVIAKHLGSPSDTTASIFRLRDHAASLILTISKKYSKASATLKTRLARTMLKTFLDPNKSFGSHYGALVSLQGLIGGEGIRVTVLPNLKVYDSLLKEGLADESKKADAELVVAALMSAIDMCAKDGLDLPNGVSAGSDVAERVIGKIGEVMGGKVVDSHNPKLVKTVLESDLGF